MSNVNPISGSAKSAKLLVGEGGRELYAAGTCLSVSPEEGEMDGWAERVDIDGRLE